MKKYQVIKEITYELVQFVDAETEDDAITLAQEVGDWDGAVEVADSFSAHEVEENK